MVDGEIDADINTAAPCAIGREPVSLRQAGSVVNVRTRLGLIRSLVQSWIIRVRIAFAPPLP